MLHLKNLAARTFAFAVCAFLLAAPAAAATDKNPVAGASPAQLDDATCLSCHQSGSARIEISDGDDERALAHVDPAKLDKSVHAKQQCVSCHTDIVDAKANHAKAAGVAKPDCISCHEQLWDDARKTGVDKTRPRLGIVVDNIVAYRNSFHARPDADNPDQPKALCHQCHATHEFAVPPQGGPARDQWRLTIPQTCGAQCHEDQLEEFEESAHGKLVMGKGDPRGAICTDCHTAHEVVGASSDPFKLKNVEACGGCHKDKLKSYRDTYHGQVHKLGFTYTAKCSNCHGSHGILGVNEPDSKIHPDNRLKTCQSCHNGKKDGLPLATEGFLSFGPHANSHDFEKYPQMWITTKFMVGLLIAVFTFFWLHCLLWYYREWQERKARKTETRIHAEAALGPYAGKHFVRFAWGWRVAHLLFALITMTLVLTGTTVMFANSSWAPVVAGALGGPKVLGLIHRIAAACFVGIFMIHFIYVMQKLLRDRNFRWFGPDSLVPNWKDFTDCWNMFKWFLGKGPRPQFDRWTYFEKFDYWAVFWGVNIIGWSGLMLAFPHVTAKYLPGWIFNVATLVHGEEAFLAAVFLFTVHFFNNHFRPDKLPPPDVVMFTGTQSIDEFRHEHPAQYQRLVESGEIEKYLVDAPSRQMHIGSVILGLTLITAGLVLLVLVTTGFFKI
ncbi:Cytochrome c family protein [Sterolibacterium denitrificans]|uniref:Cytochrome C n=2 Tax=Sterolibacterium denitrificans TaxID=157592 RepID=A0A656Z7G7_9PROT|nr:cytochrome b/b6 domain-containing protein [Sterolibacterium denitrificans]KYC29033.1 cytochrome C [Sterolibacterium denitrificans]SMB21259.1 Cytochrome c family protein [Sterolibacterium denitrificans]